MSIGQTDLEFSQKKFVFVGWAWKFNNFKILIIMVFFALFWFYKINMKSQRCVKINVPVLSEKYFKISILNNVDFFL